MTPNPDAIKALIVDDERLARLELRQALAEFPNRIAVIGEAANKREAVEFITSQPAGERVEAIFLDINMPHGSGFDVLGELPVDALGEQIPPSIVFVTAYDEYAVRAFEVNALDYLLKPIDPDRLERTVARLWGVHRKKQPAYELANASTEARPAQPEVQGFDDINAEITESAEAAPLLTAEDYVFVTIGKQRRFVPVPEIVCITANDNYTELWLADSKRALMLRTMNEWESMLPAAMFVRIHRSTIINRLCIDAERAIEPVAGGGALVFLAGIEESFAMSRRAFAKWKERV
jgi:two-component system LytT family response regulator